VLIADIYNPPLLNGLSAEEIIFSSGMRPLYEEIRRMIFDTELIISPRITVKKGKDTTGAPGLAAGMNEAFKIALQSAKWAPFAAPGGAAHNLIDWHKQIDPVVRYAPRSGIGIEIQFGNNYQFNEDIKRLSEAFFSGAIVAGISIVASDSLAKHKADRGASFSDAKSKLERHYQTMYAARAQSIPPLMIIGIEHNSFTEKHDGKWSIKPIKFGILDGHQIVIPQGTISGPSRKDQMTLE